MTFGQILQKIRRAKGKTQRDLADLIGMDYGYYSRIENDKFDYKPSRETIEKIIEKQEVIKLQNGLFPTPKIEESFNLNKEIVIANGDCVKILAEIDGKGLYYQSESGIQADW